MRHSLNSQFGNAIHSNFEKGQSKHSFKCENGRDYGPTIFSNSEVKGLRDLAKNLSGFLKENYPNVKMVRDIKQEHLDAFMRAKSETCRPSTLKTYATNLNKLGKCCDARFGVQMKDWKVDPKVYEKVSDKSDNAKLRTLAMNPDDYKAAMAHGQDCQSKRALDVCNAFGLRSREVVKLRVMDVRPNSLFVKDGKGGRSREIYADTPQKRECLDKLREYASTRCMDGQGNQIKEGRIFTIKKDSVNNYLQTNLRRAGITKYNEQKTGIHAIRKGFATNEYKRFRALGLGHREAWGRVSEELGHGRDREELFRVYVSAK